MPSPRRSRLLRPALLLLLLSLAACTVTPPRQPVEAEKSLRETAAQRAAAGDYLGAAQLYLQQAGGAQTPQAALARLRAAEYLIQGAHWNEARDVIAAIKERALNAGERDRLRLARAALALFDNNDTLALSELDRVQRPEALADGGIGYYRLRARAYRHAGNPLEAARQLIWLDGLLPENERPANQFAVWEQLASLSVEMLDQLRRVGAQDALNGWIELVLLVKQHLHDTQTMRDQLEQWRQRHPAHPAQLALLPRLLAQLERSGAQPRQIALLLPLSGHAGEAAAAIRDGILAALYNDSRNRPVARVYDTGNASRPVWSVYRQAVEEGAAFVIGPLLKDNIRQLMRSGQIDVPVLALNQIETAAPPNLPLYQFGLAPEDEARQAAQYAWDNGHRRLIAIAPTGTWGQRLLGAFTERWQSLGGELLEAQSYSGGSTDFSTPIQRALNLDGSRQRHRALERLLGRAIPFEPRRRQDVDGVFIVAHPREARLLRPQLRFHRAADLAVFSTSHVYTGAPDAARDRDMNGLLFCDIPWTLESAGEGSALREQVRRVWPQRATGELRLFALGVDAYQVIPWLETLTSQGFGFYSGATGVLSMDAERRLHRDLVWAQFRSGVPQPVNRASSLDDNH